MARSPNRRHNDRPLYNVRDARRHNGGRRSRSPEASRQEFQRRPDRGTDREQRHGGSSRSGYREYRDCRDDRGRGREHDRGNESRREDYGRLRPSSRDRGTKRAYNDPSPTRSSRENGRERQDEHDSKRSRRRTPTPPRSAEDAAKATQEARLKQVEEWKRKKQLTKKTVDDTTVRETASNSPAPLESTTVSLASPTTSTPHRRTSLSRTASPPQKDDASAFYNMEALNRPGVKFDAKAFTLNRAKGKDDKKPKVLGGHVAMPKLESRAPATQTTRSMRDGTQAEKITGFGLTHIQNDRTKNTASALMDDAEIVTRRLEKLPDMPTEELVPDENEQQDDQDDASVHSDDEVDAEAARQAFRKRAEEAEKETAIADATMADSNDLPPDEEEIDPLDAFMSTLELPAAPAKSEQPERRLFDGEDDFSMTAVGDEDMNALGAAMAAKSKKKDLPKVDHSKIDYEPFRKSFYTEPEELQNMTQEEVEELRMQLDNISVKPANAPKPIQKFSLGGFSEQILQVIQVNKYESTTPIQAQALPSIMSGRDVIGIAKTGSGKTVAYLLPMLRHVKDQRPVANLEGPIALILAPTRELATQIHRDSKPYAKSLGLRAVCAYGGSPISESIADCKRGADFMVCTPGRMIDLLSANGGRVTNLRRVTYLVLDEADRMFDLGFEPQIMKILNNIRPDAQKVLFSATFRVSMESLAHKVLNKPIQINVGGRSVVAQEIKQIVEVRQEEDKFNRLLELLGGVHAADGDERSLVFVERQETADKLFVELSRRGYPAVSIHGGREQIDRDQAIGDFRAGIYPVMVATSVAARGLDVKQLVLVVNYDSPNHLEDYVHRCGRTGRAGNKGTAVTFVTPQQDRFAKFLSQALTEAGQEVPDDIKALQSSYDEKVASGEIKKYNSGFGGRGIDRLEAARDAERARQREQHKPIDGEEAEEEEEGEEANKDKRDKDPSIEDMVKKAASAVTDRDAKPDVTSAQIMPSALNDKLNSAMVVQKAEPAPAKTANLSDPAARAAAVASSINSRLGGAGKSNRPGAPSENRGPDAGAFHAVLEINDFPQKARWSVTNRTNVAKILEATGTSITTKGNFYAPGSEPEPGGQPKLYILVEGDTELVVEAAMRELTKLLREGTYAALEEEGRKATSGRYSVV